MTPFTEGESRYPLPVSDRDFDGRKALTIVCEKCDAEAVIHPDDLLNEGLYECPADTERGRRASTEPRCGGTAIMKYEPAMECENCGKLGWETDFPMTRYCSRVCQLQGEYAESLKGAK